MIIRAALANTQVGRVAYEILRLTNTYADDDPRLKEAFARLVNDGGASTHRAEVDDGSVFYGLSEAEARKAAEQHAVAKKPNARIKAKAL